MNKDELVTVNDLDEKARRLINYLSLEFAALKKQIEEQNKPYIYWCENMSMKQAMEYTGKSKSTILAWVKDELLTPYSIGSSTSIYYSKAEIDSLKSRWEAKKRVKGLKMAV
jgi:predicted DNA-binding transcriptional regulator AlpA